MTQGDAGPAGEAADPRGTAALPAADSSAWAPLGQRVFRWLWLGVLISWIGTWMQTVGAQWQLVDEPNAAALVSLVQAASTLPMMLLALPGGVLADSFDRRWHFAAMEQPELYVGNLRAFVGFTGRPVARSGRADFPLIS